MCVGVCECVWPRGESKNWCVRNLWLVPSCLEKEREREEGDKRERVREKERELCCGSASLMVTQIHTSCLHSHTHPLNRMIVACRILQALLL